jgi:hypothetical protein
VVEGLDGEAAVGVAPPAHGEIAARDEDEVAVQHAAVDGALRVHRRREGVRGSDLLQQRADGKELPHRGDEELTLGLDVVDHRAAVEVHDAQPPRRAAIELLAEDRLDVLGQRLGIGMAPAAAARKQERCGEQQDESGACSQGG